jgi:hypothetical protein
MDYSLPELLTEVPDEIFFNNNGDQNFNGTSSKLRESFTTKARMIS